MSRLRCSACRRPLSLDYHEHREALSDTARLAQPLDLIEQPQQPIEQQYCAGAGQTASPATERAADRRPELQRPTDDRSGHFLPTNTERESRHLCSCCQHATITPREDRLAALGQMTTGIIGLLVSAVLVVQQLSTLIGVYRLQQFDHLPLACLRLTIASLFAGACVYLIQVSIRVAVGRLAHPLRLRN